MYMYICICMYVRINGWFQDTQLIVNVYRKGPWLYFLFCHYCNILSIAGQLVKLHLLILISRIVSTLKPQILWLLRLQGIRIFSWRTKVFIILGTRYTLSIVLHPLLKVHVFVPGKIWRVLARRVAWIENPGVKEWGWSSHGTEVTCYLRSISVGTVSDQESKEPWQSFGVWWAALH